MRAVSSRFVGLLSALLSFSGRRRRNHSRETGECYELKQLTLEGASLASVSTSDIVID